MDTSHQALVHQLLASRLRVGAECIRDTDRFDELGLTPLDLVLVVLRMESIESSMRSKLPKRPGSEVSVLSIPTMIASAPAWAAAEAYSLLFCGSVAIRATASAPETRLASGLG